MLWVVDLLEVEPSLQSWYLRSLYGFSFTTALYLAPSIRPPIPATERCSHNIKLPQACFNMDSVFRMMCNKSLYVGRKVHFLSHLTTSRQLSCPQIFPPEL
ncbi:hypothetical protein AMECASPLE_016886 [Ameca splendens]|uniref:Uncharacterized protein n=1 Tax=Ameca splendens TaxID=208324 RepID=A0ABV1A9I2_9TELE